MVAYEVVHHALRIHDELGCPFELEAATSLTDAHQSQLIQYLILTGLSRGKLINFGSERIEHRFVNCHQRISGS